MEKRIVNLENHNIPAPVAEDALNFDFTDGAEENSPASLGVPFMHFLSNPLKPKDLFLIEGAILKYGLRFTVNFIYGFNNIALHLNPRLDQNYIARNSYLDGEWGEEEGFGLMKSPLKSEEDFQIMIFVSNEAYLVCVNGLHMFSFVHRVPPEVVQKIEIFGDVDLKSASLLSSDIYPDPYLVRYKKKYDILHLPFLYTLEEELNAGFKIVIRGKIKMLPVSFRVNLQSGEEVFPHPLIVYHLNVRYAPECYVVQNSWGHTGKHWDEEIRSPLPLSLSPGKDFEIIILINENHILVKGEGWSLPVFKQRLNVDNVTCVYIQGDITLTFFKIATLGSEDLADPSEYILFK